MFDVEAAIRPTAVDVVLRAGYSANADVIIQEKSDVLLVPERLVNDGGGARPSSRCRARRRRPSRCKKEIEVGLSDGLNLEVVAGLAEGDKVVQRPSARGRVSAMISLRNYLAAVRRATSARRSCGSS